MSAAPAGLLRTAVADERPPSVAVRYFYTSPLVLDDPLSPVPPLASTTTAPRLPPHPLSDYDNASVDRAWNELRSSIKKYHEDLDKRAKRKPKEGTPHSSPGLRPRGSSRAAVSPRERSASKRSSQISDAISQESSPRAIEQPSRRATVSSGEARHVVYIDEAERLTNMRPSSTLEPNFDIGESIQGTTGTPFVRAPARKKASPSLRGTRDGSGTATPDSRHPSMSRRASLTGESAKSLHAIPPPTAVVPVGVSRLHQVAMPALKLQPIYWAPVSDVAEVLRATWFYKNTMLPVETEVANMLELGYIKLRPWTRTWEDELNSAVRAGSAGEEMIVHKLWPKLSEKKSTSRPGTSNSTGVKEEDSPEAQRTRILNVAEESIDRSTGVDNLDNTAAGSNVYGNDGRPKTYRQAGVIYANRQDAYLLRPNLQPSAYYGRKPFADYIRKGRNIGVAVVRGFDQGTYENIHKRKEDLASKAAPLDQPNPSSTDFQTTPLPSPKPSAHRISDLVLVVHGIGQKLSERVESYNFTYAMNGFRKEFNVQLGSNIVKPHLRNDMGGIMVLPVNWRSTLRFEEGGYRDELSDAAENSYSLKDITPDSLPNVRNIVSDVMLDIPYYLSHHQPRMIQAVIDEANRIYGLWCRNNPGFNKWGRVHVIAHSLGSVMAIDILSKQPTHINFPPSPIDTSGQSHFAFNTSNLFLAGSPAGFFLLLKKAGLRPRAEQESILSNINDTDYAVGEEAGTYGCIAVDNIYNILNPYDPVSYRLNAAVDKEYAASLKPALIPSVAAPWYAFGRSARSGYSRAASYRRDLPDMTQHFPSNVELEIHNFTKEEIAEKRAFLLNDNGQIDYFLRYGGGPLEIQYLTMLGAHSSYWTSNDFIRFLVIEIGREPGRESALECLRAQKKKITSS